MSRPRLAEGVMRSRTFRAPERLLKAADIYVSENYGKGITFSKLMRLALITYLPVRKEVQAK